MSLRRHTETIVAPITAIGGAVAVVRLSGPRAWDIASSVFVDWPVAVSPRTACYGRFVHGDDGLAIGFAEGSSYTGEESVELSVHGSPASVRTLIDACLAAGAQTAEPGEFTLRAFMNGRIDLTQAEGVRDTVEAKTERQLRQANFLREGLLRDRIRSVRQEVEGILAAVEASTDFSEEVGDLDRTAARDRCVVVMERLCSQLATEAASRVVRDGITVAIAGLPNAGKSSLLNALSGADLAIVTDVPGTTRDTVSSELSVQGLLVRLIDTAGLRESSDVVESLGIGRTKKAIEDADFVLYVYDSSIGWQRADQEAIDSIKRPCLVVACKVDLVAVDQRGLPVSTVSRIGLEALINEIASYFSEKSDSEGVLNSRHAERIHEAIAFIDRVHDTFSKPVPDDLAAVDLRGAIRALGEVTGETTPPDVIERIFQDFCIGK